LVSSLIRRFPLCHLSHLLRKPAIYRCQGWDPLWNRSAARSAS
jgi:hypothetical protein